MMQATQQLILALSTSTGVAQVVLAQVDLSSGQMIVLDAWSIEVYAEQSLTLLPKIQETLKSCPEQHLGVPSLIAVDVGPGGFTSIRTACAVGQALGMAWNVPVMPVSAFEAQFWEYIRSQHGHEPTAINPKLWDVQSVGTASCWIDARMGEWYHAKLVFEQTQFTMVTEPTLVGYDDCLSELNQDDPKSNVRETFLIHEGLQNGSVLNGVPVLAHVKMVSPSAFGVALAASNVLLSQTIPAFQEVLPLYVRNKVAQTTAERLGLS